MDDRCSGLVLDAGIRRIVICDGGVNYDEPAAGSP